MNSRLISASLLLTFAVAALYADGPADNQIEKVRRIPPPGIVVSESERSQLEKGVAELGSQISTLKSSLKDQVSLRKLLPDVEIYHKAVRDALAHNEFYKTNEISTAAVLLQQGLDRARALHEGKAPWTTSTGLVVRGYLSKIDGSVQPYGLVVPATFRSGLAHRHRLDAWFHGRGETLTELSFINDRQKSPGEFTPSDAIVLHLYGRYCNANKFAGEVDFFEALNAVKEQYPVDENRLVVRGFSMGGAACWQFAVHYAGKWAAAAPGAGFSESADFLKVFQNESLKPNWFEQKLWHWYDCTDYAINLFNCPTVAYSGESDKQKQAADIMATALAREGIQLSHIIGPQTGHKYHPEAKDEINRRIDSIVARGRNPVPSKVKFTTWTLRYNEMLWVTVDGLSEHWERGRVDAEILNDHTIVASTTNVTALTFSMEAGLCPLDNTKIPVVILDGQQLSAPAVLSDRSWRAQFRKEGNQWKPGPELVPSGELRKQHGLQGPIDDAFMDSFLMVHPTGKPVHSKVAAWAAAEEAHAIEHWRRQFRGEPRVKSDSEVTDEDIAAHNLVLWGDPTSNLILAKIASKLPIRWDNNGVHTGSAIYPGDRYAPVLVYPNPLNPKRYVVLNSGFTFREYDYLNNARQTPKLPDFAIIDVTAPVTSRAPGAIAVAGFFDEKWRLPHKTND